MADQRRLLSGEHFSVDGTIIQAWASDKSMRCKGGFDGGRPPEEWCGTTRNGGSAIDARTTRREGYDISQRNRKRIDQCYGWRKVVGPMR